MTKSDYCHGCSVICDEIYDEIDTTSWCLDFISGFISNTANLWRNLTVRHGCSVIYDKIWKRHVNIVMDHKVFCSGRRPSPRLEFPSRARTGWWLAERLGAGMGDGTVQGIRRAWLGLSPPLPRHSPLRCYGAPSPLPPLLQPRFPPTRGSPTAYSWASGAAMTQLSPLLWFFLHL
jgi:hypothetical protein